MLALAFYTGECTAIDALIRQTTASRYSHVELVDQARSTPDTLHAVSASWRDGGVREKAIAVKEGHWELVSVPWALEEAYAIAARQAGGRYDLAGMVRTQVLPRRAPKPGLWFCSQLLAWALGLSQPCALTPGGLWKRAWDMRDAYDAGVRAGRSA